MKRETALRVAADFLIPLKAKLDTLEIMMSAMTAIKKMQGAITVRYEQSGNKVYELRISLKLQYGIQPEIRP